MAVVSLSPGKRIIATEEILAAALEWPLESSPDRVYVEVLTSDDFSSVPSLRTPALPRYLLILDVSMHSLSAAQRGTVHAEEVSRVFERLSAQR